MNAAISEGRRLKYTWTLTPGWSRTIFIGWSGLTVALVCVGVSSHIIGRPVFWLDDQRWPAALLGLLTMVVVGPMIFAALWARSKRPWVPQVSLGASLVLIVVAIIDRHDSPGAAAITGALASSALLLSVASVAGSYRKTSK